MAIPEDEVAKRSDIRGLGVPVNVAYTPRDIVPQFSRFIVKATAGDDWPDFASVPIGCLPKSTDLSIESDDTEQVALVIFPLILTVTSDAETAPMLKIFNSIIDERMNLIILNDFPIYIGRLIR